MPSLADAVLKIERANKHIGDIQERILRLEDSYSALIKANPYFGYQCIEYDLADKTAMKDISVLIGDTLHNLKCALDYAWLTALERHAPQAIGPKTQFPTHVSRKAHKEALEKAKIHELSPNLFSFMLAKIKAYSGGNEALYAVKELNILDKHRLLLPLITWTGIDGLEMENEGGEIVKGSAWPVPGDPPWHIRIPDGWNVKEKGKPSILVRFDEGHSAQGTNAPSFLDLYSRTVLEVVKALDGFV